MPINQTNKVKDDRIMKRILQYNPTGQKDTWQNTETHSAL